MTRINGNNLDLTRQQRTEQRNARIQENKSRDDSFRQNTAEPPAWFAQMEQALSEGSTPSHKVPDWYKIVTNPDYIGPRPEVPAWYHNA